MSVQNKIPKETTVLYIKLGPRNNFADDCIREGKIKLGFIEIAPKFETESIKDFTKRAERYYEENPPKNKGTASRYIGELKKFYDKPETTLDHLSQ